MIIDIHTHCFADQVARRAMSRLQQSSGHPVYHDGTVAGLKSSALAAGIDISVVLPIATRPEQTPTINRWASQVTGGPIICFGTIHPDYADYRGEIRFLKEAGIRGVKMHPEYQSFYVDDKRYFALYEEIFNAGMIILFHAGGDISLQPPYHCEPRHLARMLDAFPGGTVIAAHMGGYECWDEVETLLLGRPVWLDTSFSVPGLGYQRTLSIMRGHGIDKILFGSDSPWQDQAVDLAELRSLGLTETELAAILGGNAAKLLGLS
jgi:uncharacterized protein